MVIGLPDPESGHRVDAIAQPLDPDEPSVPTTAHDRPQLDEVIRPDFALQVAPSAIVRDRLLPTSSQFRASQVA